MPKRTASNIGASPPMSRGAQGRWRQTRLNSHEMQTASNGLQRARLFGARCSAMNRACTPGWAHCAQWPACPAGIGAGSTAPALPSRLGVLPARLGVLPGVEQAAQHAACVAAAVPLSQAEPTDGGRHVSLGALPIQVQVPHDVGGLQRRQGQQGILKEDGRLVATAGHRPAGCRPDSRQSPAQQAAIASMPAWRGRPGTHQQEQPTQAWPRSTPPSNAAPEPGCAGRWRRTSVPAARCRLQPPRMRRCHHPPWLR